MSQDLGRKAVVKVEVSGMGGVGKSQLVRMWLDLDSIGGFSSNSTKMLCWMVSCTGNRVLLSILPNRVRTSDMDQCRDF